MSWIDFLRRYTGAAPGPTPPPPIVHLPTPRVNQTAARSDGSIAYASLAVTAAGSIPWQDNGTAAFDLTPQLDVEPAAGGRVSDYSAGDVVADLYRIERVIGRGKRFSVYLAKHLAWQQEVVLKTPRQEMLAGLRALAADASRWNALGLHPYIAYCHQFHLVEGVPLFVLEYVAGGSLRARINNGSAAQLPVGLDLAIQLCHGLERAHSNELWHGGLTPENILLTPEGVVRITDFWTSSRSAAAMRSPAPSSSKRAESPLDAYTAPELWLDAADLDAQTDIFALGVCLYEILCGVRPYEIARGPRRAAPEPRGRALPPSLVKLLQRCVDWDQERRPAMVSDIRFELCALYETLFGEPSPHAEALDQYCEADGWNNQALVALQQGRLGDAAAAWEQALAVDPDHVEAAYNYGVSRWRAGELTDDVLIHHLEDLAAEPTRRASASHLLALVHLERGDANAALPLLETALAEAPERTEIHATLEHARTAIRHLPAPPRVLAPHRGYISAVSLCPDRKTALSAGHDGTLCVVDTASGRVLRSMESCGHAIGAMRATSDGLFAVSGGDDGTLRLWEVRTGRCLKLVRTTGKVLSLAISADASCVLSVTCNNETVMGDTALELWDIQKERPLGYLKGHENAVKAVALSPDGRRAVSGGDDQTVRIWDVASLVCRLALPGHDHYISAMAISDDGLLAVSGSWDCTLRLWETTSGRCLRVFKGHDGIVTAVTFSADKRRIISGSWDRSVRVWDVDSGRCLHTFEGHASMVTAVDLDEDDRIVASASWDKSIRLWELPRTAPPQLTFHLSRRRPIPPLPAASHDGVDSVQQFATSPGSRSGEKLLEQAERAIQAGAWDAALSLARQLRELPEPLPEPLVRRLWHDLAEACAHTGVRGLSAIATISSADALCSLQLARDARIVITGGRQEQLRLWDVDLERCTRALRGHTDRVLDVCLNADETMALSAGADRTVRLWDLGSGECLRLMTGHQSVVCSAAISPDQQWAVSASYDHTLRIWALSTGECVRVLAGHPRQVTVGRFTTDGHSVLSAGLDGTLRLWDCASGEVRQVFGEAGDPVLAAAISADQRWIVSAAAHRPIRVWDVASGQCEQTLEERTTALALAPDGRWLASAGADSRVRLWDLQTGACAHSLDTTPHGISALAFSADGRHLAAASTRPAVLVWEIDWELAAR